MADAKRLASSNVATKLTAVTGSNPRHTTEPANDRIRARQFREHAIRAGDLGGETLHYHDERGAGGAQALRQRERREMGGEALSILTLQPQPSARSRDLLTQM